MREREREEGRERKECVDIYRGDGPQPVSSADGKHDFGGEGKFGRSLFTNPMASMKNIFLIQEREREREKVVFTFVHESVRR